jgi:hypothetical protein
MRPVDLTSRTEQAVAKRIRDEPDLITARGFGEGVRQGEGTGPALLIGDQVGIPLMEPAHMGFLDHRLSLLARPKDTVVVRTRVPSFEDYLNTWLGLSEVAFVEAHAADLDPVAKQCRTDPGLRARLFAGQDFQDEWTIRAYLTNGHVWRLAAELRRATGRLVHVAGPTPRICRRSNDKLWFCSLARDIAGQHAVLPSWHAFGPSAMAGHVAHLARLSDEVVVKVPDSAGAAGNLRLASHHVRGMGLPSIRNLIVRWLSAAGWHERYPVLVGVWEKGVRASPSAQLWIPSLNEGPPIFRGLYEQVVDDAVGAFAGARRAKLALEVTDQMTREALAIGLALQHMGYFGPCSLDAVLKDTPSGRAEVHWIECNGRWSGVSIPLAVARWLCGGCLPDGLTIVHERLNAARGLETDQALDRLRPLLFQHGSSAEGLVILAPPGPGPKPLFNCMAIAGHQSQADALAQSAIHALEA